MTTVRGVLLLLIALLSVCRAAGSSSTSSGSSSSSGSASAPPPAVSTALRWGDCEFISSALRTGAFECTTLNVPLCRAGAGIDDGSMACGKGESRVHGLTMLRRGNVVTSSSPKPTVWVVTDADIAEQTAHLMLDISENNTIQVFALQLRPWNFPTPRYDGSPNSKTPCGTLAASYGARTLVDAATMDAVGECSSWLREHFGDNGIHAFSLSNATQDLASAMRLVQKLEPSTTTSGVYLMSSGRASRVVQRFMAHQAKNVNGNASIAINGYIFDTPHAMKLQPTQDKIAGAAMDNFIRGCDTDPICSSKFKSISTTMRDVLTTAYTTLDKSPASVLPLCLAAIKEVAFDSTRDLLPSHGVRRWFAALSLQPTLGLKLLAPLLYRLHRCNEDDSSVITMLVSEIQANLRVYHNLLFDKVAMLSFVDRMTTYSEFWPSDTTRDQFVTNFGDTLVGQGVMVQQQPSYCAFTGGSTTSCRGLYKRESEGNAALSVTYKAPSFSPRMRDATTGLVGSTTADVLILTSRLSPSGASSVAEQLYDAFGTTGVSQRILVQSDNLDGTTRREFRKLGDTEFIDSSNKATLLQILDLFVGKRAKALNGKWHITDLTSSRGDVRPARPTSYATAPVVVNFGMTSTELAGWRVFRRRDVYEDMERALGDCTGDACNDDGLSRVVSAGISGLIVGLLVTGVTLVVCLLGGFCIVRRCLARRPAWSQSGAGPGLGPGSQPTTDHQQSFPSSHQQTYPAPAPTTQQQQQQPYSFQQPPPQDQGVHPYQQYQYQQQYHQQPYPQPAPYGHGMQSTGSTYTNEQMWTNAAPLTVNRPGSYAMI